jgi:hypothetical protein
VNEALRQALELQAVLLIVRFRKRGPGYLGGADRNRLGEETQDCHHAGTMGSQVTSGETAPTGYRQKKTTGAGNEKEDLRGK